MSNLLMRAIAKNKHFIIIGIGVLALFAYAIPYGMDVEANHSTNNGNHYGNTHGQGQGLDCAKFKNQGPDRCRT